MPDAPRIVFMLAAALLVLAGPTAAQTPPARPDAEAHAAAERLAGSFRLTSADGERGCEVVLGTQPAGAGFAISQDAQACAPISFAALVVAWLPDASGSIRLLNAAGRTVAEFTEAAGGSYESLREGDGVYFLGPPAVMDTPQLSPQELAGDWVLLRQSDAVACRWTLTTIPAGSGTFRLRQGEGCDEPLTRFGASSWSLAGGNVLVKGVAEGPTIRFARQEDGTWMRIPAGSRPLIMTRP